VVDELGLKVYEIEFDIIPSQKMLEIMAYHIPTNISNWKYGRDYEKQRTIYENSGRSLPYEVVINSDPSRAYLMADNVFAVQCLVMAHVFGHVNIFAENQYFKNSRQDVISVMYEANKRFNSYERRYGLDEVEEIIDAGHSIQLHSSPFDTETENDKRERIFNQIRETIASKQNLASEYSDLLPNNINDIDADLDLILQKVKRNLRLKSPVEPTSDLLRYIIDNSRMLEDWQKDVLETLRMEGQYFWPMMRTQYLNEGWAVHIHERVMNQLFKEGLLNDSEHAQYNYSNSLVKAENPFSMNPYLVGSTIWKDIEERWNKGRHGKEWDECTDWKLKEEWDTKDGKGWDQCKSVMKVYTDWMFMQNYLTKDLVRDLKLYLYLRRETPLEEEWVISDAEADEIREIIVYRFSHGVVPDIEVIDGNVGGKGELYLRHNHSGLDLDKKFAQETCKHICRLWGGKVYLETKSGDQSVKYVADYASTVDLLENILRGIKNRA
jgi:stage V sporulation protein R